MLEVKISEQRLPVGLWSFHGVGLARASLAVGEHAHPVPFQGRGHNWLNLIKHLSSRGEVYMFSNTLTQHVPAVLLARGLFRAIDSAK